MKFLSQIDRKKIYGKTCLLRLDLNVQENEINDSLRLKRSVPTILFLLKNGCRIVILSHKGRPEFGSKEEKDGALKSYSLRPINQTLSGLVGQKIRFMDNFDFKSIKKEIQKSSAEEIFMLENLRFKKEEENNSSAFAKSLATLGNFYVNDAFSVCHRKNASVVAITKYLPSFAGLELEAEIMAFSKVMKNPKKPLSLILGGVKIDDKIGVVEKFYKRADWILTGGGVANTFFAAKDIPVGKSVYDKKSLSLAKKWLHLKNLVLPQDLSIKDHEILDIGTVTARTYADIIKKSKTIIWNGPMGFIEKEEFQKGTRNIAEALGKSKAFSVVGGGETTSLILKRGLQKNASFLSIGGGAMLEYLSGNKLPGLVALSSKK